MSYLPLRPSGKYIYKHTSFFCTSQMLHFLQIEGLPETFCQAILLIPFLQQHLLTSYLLCVILIFIYLFCFCLCHILVGAHRPSSCHMGMWNLSFLTRDPTHVPCIGKWILNHRTTRKSLVYVTFSNSSDILNFSLLSLLLYCCSVGKLCPTLWDLMDCSIPGFPVLHYPSESAETHVHWVGDAIQPSHPLSSPSPPAFNLSQHQGIFQWVGSSHKVAQVLALQYQSFQGIFRVDFFQDWLVWSPCSPRDSQESFLVPQFRSINYLALSLLYGPTLTSIHDYWKP